MPAAATIKGRRNHKTFTYNMTECVWVCIQLTTYVDFAYEVSIYRWGRKSGVVAIDINTSL